MEFLPWYGADCGLWNGVQYDCVLQDTKFYWKFSLQLCGGKLSEGVFVGSFLSMSSTAVVCLHPISWNLYIVIDSATDSKTDSLFTFTFLQVVKFLVERNTNNALHVQVTIGTLIFQVSFLELNIKLVKISWSNVLWSFHLIFNIILSSTTFISGLCCGFTICFAPCLGW